MAGNIFGELFRVVTFGESHGPAMGAVIDGCPAGLELSTEDIARELQRRRPGTGAASTGRREADEPEILSGVFEGKTLGTPIAILVRNTDCRSQDYDSLRDVFRPGHADFSWEAKYGIRDHRGGGRSSGRETLCRVAAGAVAKKFLADYGIRIRAWTCAIGEINMPMPDDGEFDFNEIEKNSLRLPVANHVESVRKALKIIQDVRSEGDSIGGMIMCLVEKMPCGLGEPVFGKIDARLAEAILSIGAVKGIEIGAGYHAARMKGSENNDINGNNEGGMFGGISNGQDIYFRVAVKPTPSIAKPQKARHRDGSITDLSIKGRHDVCIAPRAVPVVEAMTALVLADLVLLQRAARKV